VRNLSEYDHCVALSEDQRQLITTAGYPSERVTVDHNAVDTDAISPGASALPRRLGARFVVAYMGRLDPEKRIPALVRTFLDLGWPEAHVLVIAGGGAHDTLLRRMVVYQPNVQMLG